MTPEAINSRCPRWTAQIDGWTDAQNVGENSFDMIPHPDGLHLKMCRNYWSACSKAGWVTTMRFNGCTRYPRCFHAVHLPRDNSSGGCFPLGLLFMVMASEKSIESYWLDGILRMILLALLVNSGQRKCSDKCTEFLHVPRTYYYTPFQPVRRGTTFFRESSIFTRI